LHFSAVAQETRRPFRYVPAGDVDGHWSAGRYCVESLFIPRTYISRKPRLPNAVDIVIMGDRLVMLGGQPHDRRGLSPRRGRCARVEVGHASQCDHPLAGGSRRRAAVAVLAHAAWAEPIPPSSRRLL
jgi:hypothetical protein